MITDRNVWSLLDANFIKISELPVSSSHLKFILNEPGSGSFDIPMSSRSAGLVASGMFAKASYRGAERGGFSIDNIQKDYVSENNQDGGTWMNVSGSGEMILLEDGIVQGDGSGASTRDFTGTKAGVLIALIEEAKSRTGCLTNVFYDFTDLLDSDGEVWEDNEPFSVTVGIDLLEVLRQIAKLGIDFRMVLSGDLFILQAYKNGIGVDRSSTVFFRIGKNCEYVKSDERGGALKNALLVAFKNGEIQVKDDVSIAAYRRREKYIDANNAQSSSSATTYGAALLENSKLPKRSISLKVYDGLAPYLFHDYGMGDTIAVDLEGEIETHRILAIQCDWDGTNYSKVTLELNNLLYENELKMAQDIDYLLSQWNTAHDSNLLEVSFWAGFENLDLEFVTGLHQLGTSIYLLSTGPVMYRYDSATGLTTEIPLIDNPLCVVSSGTDLYIGGFHSLYKYDTTAAELTLVAEVHHSEQFDEKITAMAVISGIIYVTGKFDEINTDPFPSTAKYDIGAGTWSSWASGVTGQAQDMLVVGSNIYLGGYLTEIDGVLVNAIAKWNGSTFEDAGGGSFDGTVNCLSSYGTHLLAGGSFTGRIAEWDGVAWSTFGGGLSGVVHDIDVYLADVYAVGTFTDEGNRIAKYSGGVWYPLEDGLNNTAYKVQLIDTDVYVAGSFTEAGGKKAEGFAAYFTNFDSVLDYLDNSGTFDMGKAIHNAPAAPLTNASEIPFWDAVSSKLRKITWLNMWLTIKALTDTIYVPLAQTANRILVSNGSGVVTTDAALKFDATTKQLQIGTPNSTSGDYAIIQGNDGASVFHIMEVYGSGATISPFVNGIRGEGTAASPTALSADKYMLRLRGSAYDGPGSYGGTSAEVRLVTSENHTPSAHGARIELYTTPAGSITLTKTLVIGQGGIASSVTAGKMLTLTATDNYALTVPATGTVALLEAANIYTANQRINATLGINAAPPTLYNLYSSRTANASNNSSISAIMAVTNSAYSNSSGASFQNSISHSSGSLSSSYALQGTLIAGMTGTGTLNVGAAIFGTIRQASANAITQFIGSRVNLAQDASSGTITTATNYLVTFSQGAGSTITNWEGYGFETMSKNGTIVNAYAIRVPDITFGSTTNNAIKTGKGLVVHSDQVSIAGWQDVNQLRVTSHTTQTLPVVLFQDITAATNAVRNVLQLEVQSTGTAANGLGVGLLFAVETATAGTIQNAGRVYSYAIDNTSATRKYATVITAFDYNAERIGVAVEADGSAVKLGFFGHVAAAQPSAYSLSNVSIDRSYDANATTVDELADVLGTLIADLQSMGLVG